MGIYYQYSNYTDKEIICLSDVTSIKWGCMAHYSLQVAILQNFLGFTWDGRCNFYGWTGRWAECKVAVENDAESRESDNWEEPQYAGHSDAGMAFLSWLSRHSQLERVLELWAKPFNSGAPVAESMDVPYVVNGIKSWEEYAGLDGDEWLRIYRR